MIERRDAQKWLDSSVLEEELLLTPPAGVFIVEELVPKPAQSVLQF